MKDVTLVILFCSLLLLVSCMQKDSEIEGEQSIQDIIAKTPDFENIAKPLVDESAAETANLPAENETEQDNETAGESALDSTKIEETIPTIERKCRNSAILYGGCKWNEAEHQTFNIKIKSSSKETIPGVWMIITGESGGVLYVKRTENIASLTLRTYVLNYEDMKKEVGEIKRIEILPIEDINGTEFACLNQRVYTIPEAYCKPHEAIRLNDDGTINETG
ncbi:hypothetical protein JXB27_02020 [Candidatus Woesearchaeota archaeon]|nr:hypothetical protein [Candidatus Woesearchaeota archaeon]